MYRASCWRRLARKNREVKDWSRVARFRSPAARHVATRNCPYRGGMLLLGAVVLPGAVVRGVVVVLGDVVVEFMPPMLVVGVVLPIGGVVPVVVLGVVPEVVPGVVPVVVLVAPIVDEVPGVVVLGIVDAPGVTVGDVDGVHSPELVDAELLEVDVPVPTDEVPIVLPVGFLDVLGVVELIGQGVDVCGVAWELGDAVGLIVLEGAMPPLPVVPGVALPVAEGVLLPPVVAGAEVCATAIAAAKQTTVTRIRTALLIEFSC